MKRKIFKSNIKLVIFYKFFLLLILKINLSLKGSPLNYFIKIFVYI